MNKKGEKVRSKEDEEALDRKIAEIRKKNEQIARRKEEIDKDRETFAIEMGESLHSSTKQTVKNESAKPPQAKSQKANEWDREWDAGKTSADTWKENVPEMGRSLRGGYGGYSSWGSQQRGRGRGRGRATPRSEFALHDDRTEPKRKTERHVTSTDGSNTKISFVNDTAQKGKSEKKQSQGSTGSTRSSEKARTNEHQKRDVQNADRQKPIPQSAQTNKDEIKPKREGDRRASKEDGKPKGTTERGERGRGRGASMGANRGGKGTGTERVAITKTDSKTTGSPKRILPNRRPTKDRVEGVSGSKEASSNGKHQRPNQSTPPIDNGKANVEDNDVVKQVLDEIVQQIA